MSLQIVPRNLGPCLVCGHVATGINFAVPTCAPCKAFFRRNAVKLGKIDFICPVDGDCPVTFQYRRMCNCCRLAKCFRVGMKKSLILSDTEKAARNDVVQQNREKRAQLAKTIRPLTMCRLTQSRSQYLLTTDQALLTNILGAFQQTHTLPDKSEYPSFPSIEHLHTHTFFNEYEERYKLFIDYCKLIPEFERISIDDKKHLLQNHLVETVVITYQSLSKYISNILVASIEHVYGPNLSIKVKQMVERFFAYTYDPIILKLLLLIQTLSTSINRYHGSSNMIYIYNDSSIVFAAQNVYVELLWRYLLSRASSEQDAVKFFNKLILDLLFLQRTSLVVERYICNLDNEISKMNPLMQSLWLIFALMNSDVRTDRRRMFCIRTLGNRKNYVQIGTWNSISDED